MHRRVNEARFATDDPAAVEFFRARGFVVLRGLLTEADLLRVDASWSEVVDHGARVSEMRPEQFEVRYPQNRDLWRKHEGFRALLFDTRQAAIAARFLGTSGVRLFHDHAIAKPMNASSTIPWHQDSAYWPVDRTGLSIWSPTQDVGLDGGCLDVLDASHLDGPGPPQDFLAAAPGDDTREHDPRFISLPVQRGESVILSGLTWHRSRPNVSGGRRLAYLTLWVPATARFRPEHAGWHPSAAHVEVARGERLLGEWFPLFGQISDEDEGEAVTFAAPLRGSGPSMFTASRDIRAHVEWLLGAEQSHLGRDLLGDPTMRAQIADECVRRELLLTGDRVELVRVLEEIHRSDEVRRRSVARDVYLTAPARWWSLVGSRIAEEMARQ